MGDAAFEFGIGMIVEQPPTDRDGDNVDIERASDGKELTALRILPADADRLMRAAIKLVAQLVFDQRALLFDDDDLVETLRDCPQALRLERPRAAHLGKPQPKRIGAHFVDAQFIERLAHVKIGFTRRDNAELRLRTAGVIIRFSLLARSHASTAGNFSFCSRRSCASTGSCGRMLSPPAGRMNSSARRAARGRAEGIDRSRRFRQYPSGI